MKMLKKYDKSDKIIVTAQAKVKFDYKQINLSIFFYYEVDKHFKDFLTEEGKKRFQLKMQEESGDLTGLGVEYVFFWVN